jgi:hypothetical protein
MLLMFGVVVLGLIDLRLTRRMRARRGRSSDVDRK